MRSRSAATSTLEEMLVEQDTDTGATYFVISRDVEVARTVAVGDLTSVDLSSSGEPVGVEFAFPIADVHALADAWRPVLEAFPVLKDAVSTLISA
jgi:uncharacterized protein YuzE